MATVSSFVEMGNVNAGNMGGGQFHELDRPSERKGQEGPTRLG